MPPPAAFPAVRAAFARRAAALCACALFALVLPACSGGGGDAKAGKGAPPRPAVEVLTIAPGPMRDLVDIPGQLTSELSVMIKAEVEGLLETIHFAEGMNVAKGDVLFRLRDDAQVARVHEAEAELALALAVYSRTKRLRDRDVSSDAALDHAAAERDVARARLELARVQLELMRIRAPFDGVMGALLVSPGDRLKEETEMVSIDAIDRLQLHFTLPEIAVGIVRTGIPVQLEVAPYPGDRFPGEVYFVSPTLDPASRRMLIKAWVPNADHRLRPGLFAQIEAEVGSREDALLVPESAIVPALDGHYLWRLDADDVAERVPVEVGLRADGAVEIVKGISAGDRIVSAGVDKVTAGKSVDAVPAGETREARKLPKSAGSDS